jgi:hypothetical protein
MTNFKNCLFNVCDIPLENFKMAKDGRKWKRAAGNRQTVLIHLAKHANADGTSARPSIAKLMAKTGFCHGKVCYIIDDLKVMGYIETVTKGFSRAGRRGAAVRKILMPVTIQDSNSIQSKIELPEVHTVQDTSHTVQDRIHTVQQLVDTTCPTNLSYKPVNQINPIQRLTDAFVKTTGRILGIGKDRVEFEELLRLHGEELVLSSIIKFAKGDHDWKLVASPAKLYLSRSADYLALARLKPQAEKVYRVNPNAPDWTDKFYQKDEEYVPTPEEMKTI